ncbi:FUSC family protein [Rhodanobacter sp. PCA2]|uniref:FUSC family protein n=1 Tax=Rhodanobacter sp. PCA2 TaxID=2006117 RepID=UPI0015E70847|nr:FUSC family protein [Rhodanobacter sp. PCA2]MBA2079748.1 fusaric acid resistance protein [Rhodanobacter sp. PCA2]
MPALSMKAARRWPGLAEVLAGEGRAWLFVAKTLLALYLAAWLAMWLRLEQPATAMITVGIVMHPHSGMVLAKSFYRALGTLCGSAFGLALMCVFPQQRELFLLSLSVWVALCAGGATLYRNFMSYGFVLAGYTAAIVALPAINDPLGVFDSALMRVCEVMLGLVVAGVVSDVLFPERLRPLLRQRAREHFAHFIDFVRGSTGGSIPRAEMEQAHLRFVRAAVELENLRASVIFEDPEVRARSTRMRLLNQHNMAAATSFQSLHHTINRLQREGRTAEVDALIALYRPLGAALATAPGDLHEPAVLAPRLRACARQLPAREAELRAGLAPGRAQLAFDTGATLLRRFLDELCAYVEVELALRGRVQRGGVERVHFRRGNDATGAAVAVLRTFLTMTVLSAFWIASGWPFGASAMLLATIFSGLLAAAPNPLTSAFVTLLGFAGGILAALHVAYGLLPGSSGFVMLVAASLPFLAIGPWLNAHAEFGGMGGGFSIGIVYILALKDPMVYDLAHALNDAIAQLAGVALAAASFVFVPRVTGSGWQRRRQVRRLRGQVVLAATAPLQGLPWRFESVSRDLFHQVIVHTRPGSRRSRELLAWALAVQESGRALIELRQQLRASTASPEVRAAVDRAVQAVAQLYHRPDAGRRQQAEDAVRAAIDACAGTPTLRPRLYQLLGALRDDESPLAAWTSAGEPADAP